MRLEINNKLNASEGVTDNGHGRFKLLFVFNSGKNAAMMNVDTGPPEC